MGGRQLGWMRTILARGLEAIEAMRCVVPHEMKANVGNPGISCSDVRLLSVGFVFSLGYHPLLIIRKRFRQVARNAAGNRAKRFSRLGVDANRRRIALVAFTAAPGDAGELCVHLRA